MNFLLAFAILCVLASTNAAKLDKPSSYIINGNNVSAVIPYYAYLEIHDATELQGNMFFGGGVLITDRAVLTVAQNIVGFHSWRIGVGGIRIQDLDWHIVATAHPHPSYNSAAYGDNIAVLILAVPVTISWRVMTILRMPLILPQPLENDVVDIVGFGFGATANQPIILHEAQLTVTSQAACGDAYNQLIAIGQLGNHFCAGNATALSNICAGDQGGPVVHRDFQFLAGLQSFNRVADCGHIQSQPAAFIRVNQYAGFINNIINPL